MKVISDQIEADKCGLHAATSCIRVCSHAARVAVSQRRPIARRMRRLASALASHTRRCAADAASAGLRRIAQPEACAPRSWRTLQAPGHAAHGEARGIHGARPSSAATGVPALSFRRFSSPPAECALVSPAATLSRTVPHPCAISTTWRRHSFGPARLQGRRRKCGTNIRAAAGRGCTRQLPAEPAYGVHLRQLRQALGHGDEQTVLRERVRSVSRIFSLRRAALSSARRPPLFPSGLYSSSAPAAASFTSSPTGRAGSGSRGPSRTSCGTKAKRCSSGRRSRRQRPGRGGRSSS